MDKFKKTIIRVLVTLIAIEIALRLAGFVYDFPQMMENHFAMKRSGNYKVVLMGDSILVGVAPFVRKQLSKQGMESRFEIIDKARHGETTSEALKNLEFIINLYHPDAVMIMLGLNDVNELNPGQMNEKDNVLGFLKVYRFGLIFIEQLKKEYKDTLMRVNKNLRSLFLRFKVKKDSGDKYIDHEAAQESYELAKKYMSKHMELESQQAYLEAVRKDPNISQSYIELGRLYVKQKMFNKAEDLFKERIKLNPNNFLDAYIELSLIYQKDGKKEDALEILKSFSLILETIKDKNKKMKYYNMLAGLYKDLGNDDLSQKYRLKINKTFKDPYRSNTIINFSKIRNILIKNHIKLFLIQYPLCDLIRLEEVFKDRSGVIFIDNSIVFRDALRTGNYYDYFIDTHGDGLMQGVIWGHCTDKGKVLMAENIVHALLAENPGKS